MSNPISVGMSETGDSNKWQFSSGSAYSIADFGSLQNVSSVQGMTADELQKVLATSNSAVINAIGLQAQDIGNSVVSSVSSFFKSNNFKYFLLGIFGIIIFYIYKKRK